MKIYITVLILWVAGMTIAEAQAVSDPKAYNIVRKSSENMRGQTSFAEMTIQTIRPSWSREMQMKTWTKGRHYAMILILAPAKEKGVAFLKRNKEVWNWVPSLERTIKLPPSMMSQSWMGTDFTNDDLVKETSLEDDYILTFGKDTTIGGRSCHTIIMTPKPGAAIVWGKVITCIDKVDFLQLHARFYDEDEDLVNTMNASDIRMLGGRKFATQVEMLPAGKKGHKTVIRYTSMIFDQKIEDTFFTMDKMKTLK